MHGNRSQLAPDLSLFPLLPPPLNHKHKKSLAITHNWNVKPAAPVSEGLLHHQRFGSSCMAASFGKDHLAKTLNYISIVFKD